MPDKIGNPLDDMAETGTLGKKPQQIKETEATQTTRQVKTGDQDQKARVKRTLMFTPQRARWLKIQAAQEEREMSDIVEEALATYQQLHT